MKTSQRRSAPTHDHVPDLPATVHEVVRSPGRPLERETRAFFEPRFGHDFSQVRVHADGKAAESARDVHALAYSVGPHIAVRDGWPASPHLLAHELAHVVQQLAGGRGGDAESRANAAARSAVSGQVVDRARLGTAAVGLHRQEDGEDPWDRPLTLKEFSRQIARSTRQSHASRPPAWLSPAARDERRPSYALAPQTTQKMNAGAIPPPFREKEWPVKVHDGDGVKWTGEIEGEVHIGKNRRAALTASFKHDEIGHGIMPGVIQNEGTIGVKLPLVKTKTGKKRRNLVEP